MTIQARRPPQAPVHRITDARPGITDDQSRRVRGYVITMSVRVVLFLVAVAVHGPLRWLLIAGATFLPYIAVVFANGGREPNDDHAQTLIDPIGPELPPGQPKAGTGG